MALVKVYNNFLRSPTKQAICSPVRLPIGLSIIHWFPDYISDIASAVKP